MTHRGMITLLYFTLLYDTLERNLLTQRPVEAEVTGGAPAQLPAEAATSEPTRIGAAHTSAAATRASVTASKEDSPATREETAEAAAAARGEAATGEEVPLQAGAAAATGEADEAGPEAVRKPQRQQKF